MAGTAKDGGILHNRDFVILWATQFISAAGSTVSNLALPLLALYISHSPITVASIAALAQLPYVIFGLPAGLLVDRWDRKKTMMWCDVGRMGAMASIPTAAWLWHVTIVQLGIVAVVSGTLFVLFDLAEASSLLHVVTQEQLPKAVSWNQAASYAAAVSGAPIGGVLFEFARPIPFVVDACSFAASVIGLRAIKKEFQAPREERRESLATLLMEGVRWLWRQRLMRALVVLLAGATIPLSGIQLLFILIARQQHASASTIGFLFALTGAGGILGAAFAGQIVSRLGFARGILTWFWACSGLWIVLGFAPNLIALSVVFALIILITPTINVLVGHLG